MTNHRCQFIWKKAPMFYSTFTTYNPIKFSTDCSHKRILKVISFEKRNSTFSFYFKLYHFFEFMQVMSPVTFSFARVKTCIKNFFFQSLFLSFSTFPVIILFGVHLFSAPNSIIKCFIPESAYQSCSFNNQSIL